MNLSRGASRCFNLLRSYLHGKDHCWPCQATLAARLDVDPRTIQRHLKELRAAGLITSKQRGDGRSVLYKIVGADVGADVGAETPQAHLQETVKEQDLGQNVGAETLYLSLEENPEKKNYSQSECTIQKPPTEGAYFSSTETQAVERHIRCDGFEPTAELISKLEQKAKFWRKNGFQVCAAIERAVRKVQGGSNAPRSLGWFVRCVENEFSGLTNPREKPKQLAGPQPSSIPVSLPKSAGSQVQRMTTPQVPLVIRIAPQRAQHVTETNSHFSTAIEALARAKTLGRRL